MAIIKRYFFFCIIFSPLGSFGQSLPQNQVFAASNEVFLTIFGTNENFQFRSEKFAGRYDNNQKLFEFILPISSVSPLDETNDITVVNDLFFRNKAHPVINLTASFNDPLINIEDFKTPQELVLDGWLTVADRKYNIPVLMSFFYNNDILYYKLQAEIDMYQLEWSMPEHYRKFLTGLFHLQVNEGRWSNSYLNMK